MTEKAKATMVSKKSYLHARGKSRGWRSIIWEIAMYYTRVVERSLFSAIAALA